MTPVPSDIPPQNIEAESFVLGICIIHGETHLIGLLDRVKPSDFFRPAHAVIYSALLDMLKTGKPINLPTVAQYLQAAGTLRTVGRGVTDEDGRAYLVEVSDGYCFDWRNLDFYVEELLDASRRRQLMVLGAEIASQARAPGATAEEVEGMARTRLAEMTTNKAGAKVVDMWQAAQEAAQYADDVAAGKIPPGIMTGIEAIDAATGGMQPGDLWVLGADTSVGKTGMAVQIASGIAHSGGGVFCVSAEMTRRQYANRVTQSKGRIDGRALRTGKLEPQQRDERGKIIDGLKACRFRIIDQSSTIAEVLARAQMLSMEWGDPIKLIVVDYLQLMRATTGRTRAEAVSNIAWACKEMAMKLGCAVLLLSQLDRASVKGTTQPPGVHSLKESGDIENHSNVILLLHRPRADVDLDGTTPIWVKVAKSRDGERTPWPPDPAAIILRFCPKFTRFDEGQIF